jgi:hypothetical protein
MVNSSAVKVLVLGLVTCVWACSSSDSGADKEIDGEVKRVSGRVVTKDIKESLLLLETVDTELNLTATSMDAKHSLQKINVGDTVNVGYTQTGGKLIAVSIVPEARPGGCPEGRPCPGDEKKPRR